MVVFSEINAALELLSKTANAISKLASIDPQIVRDLEELRRLVITAIDREAELMLRVQELEQQLVPPNLIYDDDSGAHFDPSDMEKKRPFCTRCLEEKRLPLTLAVGEEASQCRSCGSKYQNAAQKRAEEFRHSRLPRYAIQNSKLWD